MDKIQKIRIGITTNTIEKGLQAVFAGPFCYTLLSRPDNISDLHQTAGVVTFGFA